MKLAYVLNTYPQPSHSFIRREMQALERRGFEITRLAMRRAETPPDDPLYADETARTEYVLDQGAVRLLAALALVALRSPVRTARALALTVRCGRVSTVGIVRHMIYLAEAAWVARRCSAAGIDHLHAHFGTNSAMVAMLAGVIGGTGFSFTAHGPEEFDAPAALSLAEKIRRAAFVVAVSQFGRSQLLRWVSGDIWDRVRVVHCGIEPGAFADPAPMPEGPLRLVSIGRFSEQKGQMMLIRALDLLRVSHGDIHLTLIGDGEMRGALSDAVASAGLGSVIAMPGWLDEAALHRHLADAHLLVMPSFAEGLPMVMMEAMAAARPVIGTYVAGIPELVQDDRTGWLVPAGDTGALADAIKAAAQCPRPALAAMGLAARARVLERHDIDTEAARLAGLFRDVRGLTDAQR